MKCKVSNPHLLHVAFRSCVAVSGTDERRLIVQVSSPFVPASTQLTLGCGRAAASAASQITASSVTTGAIAKAHFTPHQASIPPATGPGKNPRSAAALNPPMAATMCSRGDRALIRIESPFVRRCQAPMKKKARSAMRVSSDLVI